MFKKTSRHTSPPISYATQLDKLATVQKERPLTAADLQAHGFAPAVGQAEAHFGAARAVYKLCKPSLRPGFRAVAKAHIYNTFEVPQVLLDKHQARKDALAKLSQMQEELTRLQLQQNEQQATLNGMQTQIAQERAQFAQHIDGLEAQLHQERFDLVQRETALRQRTEKIGALLGAPQQNIRVSVGSTSQSISLDAIKKYPASVLAGLCEDITTPEVPLPESGHVTPEVLPHIANFYHGIMRPLYAPAEARAIKAAADWLFLPELAEHISKNTDAQGSATFERMTQSLAEVTSSLTQIARATRDTQQAVQALQTAVAPSKGWKCTNQILLQGNSLTTTMEPVGMGSNNYGSYVLLREPNE